MLGVPLPAVPARFGYGSQPRPEQSQHVARVRMLETAGERKAASESAGERTESSENAEVRKARDRPHPRKRTLGPPSMVVACCRINAHAPSFEHGIHMARIDIFVPGYNMYRVWKVRVFTYESTKYNVSHEPWYTEFTSECSFNIPSVCINYTT